MLLFLRTLLAKNLACLGLLGFSVAMLPSCDGDAVDGRQGKPVSLPPAGEDEFSGKRAYAHVKTIVGFGPRPVGSRALEGSRLYIEEVLQDLGWQVQRQSFKQRGPRRIEHAFVNLRARFPAPGEEVAAVWERGATTVVASHYDTKMFDNFTFVGANDGGSSTGALLEIGRVMALQPELASTLELVFFDGEEAFGRDITPTDGLYGSRHYQKFMRTIPASQRPSWGVLLDMIGDKDLVVTIPRNSARLAAGAIFKAARELGVSAHFTNYPGEIIDDHIPMNEAGIKTVDVIDIKYDPFWHTRADTMDKISADSLDIVGRTVVLALQKYIPPK